MLKCNSTYEQFVKNGIDFFTGVPDSLLSSFLAYITENTSANNHIIAANEGNAVALACGHYLAKKQPALVYMQNSGLGNAINPLISLADKKVYGIPLVLMIGWRGEPGYHDEPQHIKQGEITLGLLNTLGIEYAILPADQDKANTYIANGISYAQKNSTAFAFVVRKNTFDKYILNKEKNNFEMTREDSLQIISKHLDKNCAVVSTTGKTSRELYEIRAANDEILDGQDFYTVGSMGHTSQIALGIALSKPDKKIICIDGDGAFIMHMGAGVINANQNLKNFKHIVINNGAHDSVGGHPTLALNISISGIASSCGYTWVKSVQNSDELNVIIKEFLNVSGSAFLEIKVRAGARSDLGRPTTTTFENKEYFMSFLDK